MTLLGSQSIWSDLQTIKKSSPLIHNITNYVVMESSANGLLAIGASPIMAHAIEEVSDIVKIANCLILNIGTLSPQWIIGMRIALHAANQKKIPVVLDPVGSGATTYRTNTAQELLQHGKITVIRGNASEISSLFGDNGSTKGVDSLLNSKDCQEQAKNLALQNKCTIWMSGLTDVITDGKSTILVDNGHPFMSKVTGMGCLASAITGAFLSINSNVLISTAHAAITMGIVGEIAARVSLGPATFKLHFIDHLYKLSLEEIEGHIRLNVL